MLKYLRSHKGAEVVLISNTIGLVLTSMFMPLNAGSLLVFIVCLVNYMTAKLPEETK